jgi:hypothetical protein
MLDRWLSDIESLEAIRSDSGTLTLVLHMAAMSKAGALRPFVDELHGDAELDEETRRTFAELAGDEAFLLAVEEYVRRTSVAH